MKITINGTEHDIDGDEIGHELVCELAGMPVYASVTYSGPLHGDYSRQGITYVGKAVKIQDGMDFTCVVTGNA